MSLVTMFLAVPPTAAAPSCTPFQENSLNDLSSSWPMSVTIPTFRAAALGAALAVALALAATLGLGLGLGLATPPQAATMSPTARPRTRRRFMFLVRPPTIRRAGARSADSRSGEDTPQDVTDEHNVEAPPEHQRRQRKGVLARAQPKLYVDQQAREKRENGGDGAELAELPRRQKHTDGDREGRLEDHRSSDVPERDHVLPVARPDE